MGSEEEEEELQPRQKSDKGNMSPEQEWNLRKYLRPSLVLSRKKAGKGEGHLELTKFCYCNSTMKYK